MSSSPEPAVSLPSPEPAPKGLWTKTKNLWRRIANWWRATWIKVRPGAEARKGAIWAALLTAAFAAGIGGYFLESGFGLAADLAFAFVVGALTISLILLLVALLMTIFRRLPRVATGLLFGVCLFITIQWPPQLGIVLGIIVLLAEGFLGAAIATLFFGNFRQAALSKKIITFVLIAGSLATNAGLTWFFANDGTEKDVLKFQETASPAPPALTAPNPAATGPLAVKTLFYGNGNDIRRPEYGSSVAIKTNTVDASLFFKDFKGWKANLRHRYWGFGMDKLPLNARVWYPDGPGPFPLVLIVHGNHNMAEFSDPGYQYLGELLASRGFILASIDENFLNGGLFHDPPKQQAVRGWMLLEHLKLWRTWNTTPGNPFFKKVDVDNVALMGHSRGGEAVATAALFNRLAYDPDDANIKFNYNFPIKSLVAIAPADGQYKPAGQWRTVDNVNYLTLQGANDGDVSSFLGSRQWDRIRYTAPGPWFKSEIYIYRANHGQFNTVWGRSDAGEPFGRFLNLKPLLKPEDQRLIGKIYISAFLEATLHDRREYLPLFRDYRRIGDWLPKTFYMSRYQDASYQLISDFSEDPDLTTTTIPGGRIQGENLSIWREARIPFRHGDRDYNGVYLGWNREPQKGMTPGMPVYSISLPEAHGNPGANPALSLSVAVTDEDAPPPGLKPDEKPKDNKKDEKKKEPEPTDFTVEIQSADGTTARVPLSRFGLLPPPFKVQFTKIAAIDSFAYEKSSEPIFQTIEIPLSAFGVDAAKIRAIRLRFDRTPTRVIILSKIGFTGGV
ncbi:MAG TPA: hypothetical protein VKU01_20450 [Bryobacteraceae bacterium]|nr:hypothetical protein [Bryobacteraceae bacterium]